MGARLDPLDPVMKPCPEGGRLCAVCHSCVFQPWYPWTHVSVIWCGKGGLPLKNARTLLLVILENIEHALYRFVAPLICCKSRTLSLTLELLLLWRFISEPTRGSPSATKSSGSRSNIKSFHLFIYLDVDYLKKKSFAEFVTISLLLFMFWFFDCGACGILAPPPGIKPIPAALEGGVLTTGPPGKSPVAYIY